MIKDTTLETAETVREREREREREHKINKFMLCL